MNDDAAHQARTSPTGSDRLNVMIRLAGVVLTLMSVFLHGLNATSAGGLWRDEANSATVALLPDLPAIWATLQLDSFPVLHYLVIRGWALLAGPGEGSLRILGLAIGLLLIAALWFRARSFGGPAPLISLLLIGMNPVMIRFLDAVRPNGLAALATVLAFTLVGKAITRTDARHLLAATAVLTASVQIIYQAALFVLALGLAAMAAGFRLGGARRAALLAVPFMVALLSLLPYRGTLQAITSWSPLAMPARGTHELASGLLMTVTAPLPWMQWIWLSPLALAAGCLALGMARPVREAGRSDALAALDVYCGMTMVGAAALYFLFFDRVLRFSPKPWHYIPLLILAVISCETLVDRWVVRARGRLCLGVAVLAISLATIPETSVQVRIKSSTMDLAAAGLAEKAQPTDLIVIAPWYYGVSFSRYYHGRVPWMSFPALRDNTIHRFDLLKESMVRPERVADDRETVLATLKRGGTVWMVGSPESVQATPEDSLLPPAPLPLTGWSCDPFLKNWNDYLMTALHHHAVNARQIPLPGPALESPLLTAYSGYRE